MAPPPDAPYEAIAIVGLAARLPGAESSMATFWAMLQAGQRARAEMPRQRVNIDAHYHPSADRQTTTNVRHAHWLQADMAAFDAPFFAIQPLEAESMDPQQRMLLETSYHALENAGIPMERTIGSRTSVYIAATAHDYEIMQFRDPETMPKYMSTGTAMSLLSNRISWFFDFRGPSISLDTACSGSLTAIHLACQSLRDRESEMALVGGVSLNLVPEVIFSQLSTLGFLSPDGCSYSFDARANGYGKGEGMGVVVLKRVSDAVQDGDTIRAVIRSSAINQDGRTPGITQPSKRAQTENILHAYERAGLSLDETAFFEAHGTGTAIGDPFEAEAIHAAFRRPAANPLYVGALKANIGHLEAGAGIAATIKAVHMLEYGIIPPLAGFETRNPNIPEEWNLKFLKAAIEFPDGVRRISVNSFGYGGTNAHVIFDDAASYIQNHATSGQHATLRRYSQRNGYHSAITDSEDQLRQLNGPCNGLASRDHLKDGDAQKQVHVNGHGRPRRDQMAVLVLSAADELGVTRIAGELEKAFSHVQQNDEHLANLAYTLSQRRSDLPWKAFTVSSQLPTKGFASSFSKPVRSSSAPAVSCIFTGQGAQWYGMARGLDTYPLFFQHLKQSEQYLREAGCKWNLVDELNKDEDISRVDQPELAQTLCTALQIALVDLLISWGIRFRAVTGHSSGEIAATYCIGALSHKSAILVAWHRGCVAARVEPGRGSMMAVAMSEAAIQTHLEAAMQKSGHTISLGCVNGPSNVTVSGDTPAIDMLQNDMDQLAVFARKLQVDVAYHSHHMAELAQDYRARLRIDPGHPTSTVMFSSVTGEMAVVAQVSKPEYWVRNLVSTVRFADALGSMATYLAAQRSSQSKDVVIEIGPHPALQRPAKDIFQASKNISYDFLLTRGTSSKESLAHAMGRLRCQGYPVNLALVTSTRPASFQLLTTLPSYPFHHSQTYWSESRISRGLRFREHPRHELLGVRESDWNPLLPRWRNVIRAVEHPWINDHRMDDEVHYPAAGLIVMAIEAARQLTTPCPTTYLLRNVSFPSSFPILNPHVEAQIQLIPQDRLYDFVICMTSGEAWIKVCEGSIECNPAFHPDERAEALGLSALKANTTLHRWEKMQSGLFYQTLNRLGFNWQSTFQNLEDLRFRKSGEAFARTTCGSWRSKIEDAPDLASHIIHPVDLDAIIQSSIVAYSQAGTARTPTVRPTRINTMWISSDTEDNDLRVHATVTMRGVRNAEFSIGAADSRQVRVLIEGCRQTQIKDEVSAQDPTRQSYRVEWRPDIDLLPRDELEAVCSTSWPVESVDAMHRQELVCLYYVSRVLNESRTHEMSLHLARYMAWMEQSFDLAELNRLRRLHPTNEQLFHNETRDAFLVNFEQETCEGTLFCKIGENLSKILRGEIDPLELLYGHDNLANEYFASMRSRFSPLMSYLDLLAFKTPTLKILEVGAGTGSMTGSVLQTLLRYTDRQDSRAAIPRLTQYTFTDISPAFFENAQTQFSGDEKYMSYAVLDLERDPLDQGFEEHTFDIVVASMVLYATTELNKTLQHLKKVLKPSGKLIVIECTAPRTVRAGFAFGLLPGWWLGQEAERLRSPLLTPESWDATLQANGFTGIEAHFSDGLNTYSGFVSRVRPPPADIKDSIIVVATAGQQQFASDLCQELSDFEVKIEPPERFWGTDAKGSRLIILVEMVQDFFADLPEQQWQGFLRAIWTSKSILWVTSGAAFPCVNPMRSIITGFGRAIRSEDLDAKFIELSLASKSVKHIPRVYRQSLQPHEDLIESEFVEKDGSLCIGRLSEAIDTDRMLSNAVGHRRATLQPFGQQNPLHLTTTAPGHLPSLCFDEDLAQDEPLAQDEVEIEVAAASITHEDLQTALGKQMSDSWGHGCSGVVTRIGTNSRFSVGDRVCACTGSGGYKTFARANHYAVLRIPDSMGFPTAAGLLLAFTTAHYALFVIGRLEKDESVLIVGGQSYVGQAAIQLAQNAGARVLTTCASIHRSALAKLHKIPESHILNEQDDPVGQVQKLTGQGVDVVLREKSSELACLAPFGRDIVLVQRDSTAKRFECGPNRSHHMVEMHEVIQNASWKLKRTMASIEALLRNGTIWAPQPVRVFSISNVGRAFESLQHQSDGCAVLCMAAQDLVPVLPSTRPLYSFHAHATYVIAGGLGGLGGAIVEWMAGRGARHFLLLSRSGGASNEIARNFIAEMKTQGVHIFAPKCDITDAQHVAAAVKACKESMPPIRGCIQGAMVLRETLLQGMTAQDVHDVLRPKTIGTLNLDAHMPDGMDFLVLLSSLSALVGFRGIANYAAANAFLDSFARSRASPRRPCLALDLGAVKSVGVIADRGMFEWLLREGLESLASAELFALLDWACNPTNPAARSPVDAHLVTGLAGVETMRADHFQGVYWSSKPMLRPLIQCNIAKQGMRQTLAAEVIEDWAGNLAAAPDETAAKEAALAALVDRLARLLAIPRADVDTGKSIESFGIDSLITMELRQWVKKTLNADVGLPDISGSASIEEFADMIAKKTALRI